MSDDGPQFEIEDPDYDLAHSDLVDEALRREADDDSHVEADPNVIHASQIGYCDRRAYCSKLGLDDHSEIRGVFQTGTLVHEWLEEHVREIHDGDVVEPEADASITVPPRAYGNDEPITFLGTADLVDHRDGCVVDYKTRSSWYNFDPPTVRHVDQLLVYMAALGVVRGRIVYISKSDLETRCWPEEGYVRFDPERFGELVRKAERIGDAVREHGIAGHADEIPFETCGGEHGEDCYFCQQETLSIPAGEQADEAGDGDE